MKGHLDVLIRAGLGLKHFWHVKLGVLCQFPSMQHLFGSTDLHRSSGFSEIFTKLPVGMGKTSKSQGGSVCLLKEKIPFSSREESRESNRIWRWATEWLCQESCSAEWNLSLARHAVHMCAHWEGKGYTWWPKEIVLTPGSLQPYNLAVHSPLTHNREKVVFPFSLHSKEGFESIRSLWNQKLLFITVKAANMGDFRLGYHWL